MRIFVVDAFTDRAFTGNPAGVCLLTEPADPAWMLTLAAEMRHSETAYLIPKPASGADFGLRWFTPATEVSLCGHATLASAHVLFSTGIAESGRISFETASGILHAECSDSGEITLDFPSRPMAGPAPTAIRDAIQEAIGAAVVQAGFAGEDVLAEVADEATVRQLNPDIPALKTLEARGIIVTATADDASEYDIVSRFFAPSVGIDEDPFTGSAHCALMPYWGERLGKDSLRACQLSPRTGTAEITQAGDRVKLTGTAVTVLSGELSPEATTSAAHDAGRAD